MPVYAYKGLNQQGRAVSGIIDADSPKGARVKLRRTGVFPTDLAEQEARRAGGVAKAGAASGSVNLSRYFERIAPAQLALMTRQLSTLVGAGLPLVDCLSALIEQIDQARIKRVFSQVREQVTEGVSLADALKAHPRIFNDLYVNMVRAGEASGALDIVLQRLADYTEDYAKLRNKVQSALTYPVLMAMVSGGILFFLLSFVVPQVTKMFENTSQTLPWMTVVLLAVSGFLREYWWVVLFGIGAIVMAIRLSTRTPAGQMRFDRYLLAIPYAGTLLKKVALARFARTLSTLLNSGITLLLSLDIVKNVVNNTVLAKAIEDAREAIREGQSIAPPLQRSGLFPSMLIHMIAVGERSGELEAMLAKAADAYDNEVDSSIVSLTSVMEPLMILFMGGVVLFIVLAILVPIFQLNELVR
ncbi:MAG TPA: type II secretion system inner membrane protein GspF [Terriglobales bacterium]|nr:type II secretion system inner membrane protein GspF [Terriglobales bacterium]